MLNKNERSGTADQAKGKVKQAVGTLIGDDKLKADGQVDETVGKVESAVGRTSRKVGNAITSVGKAVKR
ncbi:MAG TPA: CsbD family protein [Vicinamibacterales bacterium]|nr:CsbD family protein [Vicinamibacterales bacterium]